MRAKKCFVKQTTVCIWQTCKFCLFTNPDRRKCVSSLIRNSRHPLKAGFVVNNVIVDSEIVRSEFCTGEIIDRDGESFSPVCYNVPRHAAWFMTDGRGILLSNTFDVFSGSICSCVFTSFILFVDPVSSRFSATFESRYPAEQAGHAVFRNNKEKHDVFE